MRVQGKFGVAAILCAAALLCVPALAQRPGGFGGGFNPEELAKAWGVEASSVAKSLSLNEEQSKKLLDAYKASRESLGKAMADLRSGGSDGGGREAFRKAVTDERAKFETALKGFLDADQTSKVLASLGSFDLRFDLMTNSLAGLGLEEKAMADAMGVVSAYIAESAKAREAAGGDRDKMRETAKPLRDKLDADLGKILTAEQVAKLQELPGFRLGGPGGGRQRDGEGGRRGGGAPGGGAPAGVPPAPPEKN